MYTENTFRSELNSLENAYRAQKPRWYKMAAWGVEVSNAWDLYWNARTNHLQTLILGGEELRSDEDLIINMGTTSATPVDNWRGDTVRNFRSGSNTKGSLLKEKYWWPMANDAWVLGGLHGLAQFHLAAASTASVADDMLWDTKARPGRPRVLGRELIGLFNFGYIRIGHAQQGRVGIVFAPHNAESAKAATFTTYLSAITNVGSAANIRNMMDPSVAYDKYTVPA